ncbi:MAG: molybdopterin molybdotransferase MoeA [Actinomycetaceae bacterium]|nr:molybdopterin molybdotransferase MoeA [Actinomycetaceae bacterium]
MTTVAEFSQLCLNLSQALPPFNIEIVDALGCITSEDIHSKLDMPPHNIATTDGYAITAIDKEKLESDGKLSLPVVGDVHAHSTHHDTVTDGTCVRVFSGSPLPHRACHVVRLDHTDRGDVTVNIHTFSQRTYIEETARIAHAGDVIIKAHTRLTAKHIALLVAAGYQRVMVHPTPRVAIISIGNELIDPGTPLTIGHTYDVNSYALSVATKAAGAEVYRVHASNDDRHSLRDIIDDQLVRSDVIITTGGLSEGDHSLNDIVSTMENMRLENISMTPEAKIGAGTVDMDNTLMFCLPGNPVAALTCFDIFIRPALRKISGYTQNQTRIIKAKASTSFEATSSQRDYISVFVSGNPSEGYTFTPLHDVFHRDVYTLSQANGYAIVPEYKEYVASGDELECFIFNK